MAASPQNSAWEEHSWQERRSPTLKDIARLVGVSEATVSVVVNGSRSGTRVSSATRAAVLTAAERLGYRPNVHARSLLSGRSNRFGLYSGRSRLDARNLFFAELLGGMLEGSVESHNNTVIHTSGNSDGDLLDLVSNRAIDGLIVHIRAHDPIMRLLDDLRVPAVAVADRTERLASITVDDQTGGRLLGEHLASKGHRHVLIKQAEDPPQSAVDRIGSLRGYLDACGIETTQVTCAHNRHQIISDADLGLISRGHRPVTAIVGWCDIVAEWVCQAALENGMTIPDDVAVVGFDGFALNFYRQFDLTTIRAPWCQVGRTAVSTLSALVRGESVPALTVLPVEFIQGRTT